MSEERNPQARDGELLAAYLVGELEPRQQQALEGRLEREPALRARLDTIRRADEQLRTLAEAAPAPRSGFSERLHEELLPAVREQLTADTDELAQRRARRQRWQPSSWMAPLGAAAAVLALIAVVGVGLSQFRGGDEDSPTAGSDVAMETMEAGEGAAEEPGPVVVGQGRSYTSDDVATIVDDDVFQEVLGLGSAAAAATSDSYRYAFRELTTTSDGAVEEEAGADEGVAAEGDAETLRAPPATLHVRGTVTEEELDAVRECLPQLFEEAGTVVPTYAELADFEGEPAIIYGLVTEGAEPDGLTRIEVWVVDRASCEVRYFTQQDRS